MPRDSTGCAAASELDADVVIVGAGPVGLLLAGDLAEREVRVLVVEQRTAAMTESRASTLHARTMRMLADRGILDRLGALPSGGPGHFGGIRLDLTAADPEDPYAGQWKCPQTRLEAVLQQRALEAGADIRRGYRVVGSTDRDDRVYIRTRVGGREQRLTAAYLVGCDGERSTVRELGGFDFAGFSATKEMLRADVAGIDIPARRFERLPRGLATAARWPDGGTRVMVHVYGAEPKERADPDFDEIASAWSLVTGESIGHGKPLWCNAFDNTSRQVTQYRRGRILLAGDAAHRQMPVGGQALNLGLHDAAELGGRLAGRVRAVGDDELLDGYHHERHPAGARTLANIRAQTALLLGGPEVEPVRELMTELMRIPAVHSRLASMISGVLVKCDAGRDRPSGESDSARKEIEMTSRFADRPEIRRSDVVTTLVTTIRVDPGDDSERVAARVIDRWQGGRWPAGLAAVSCFCNLNGRSVLVYEQWTSASAARNSMQASNGPRVPGVAADPPVEYVLYRTVSGTVGDAPPAVECYPVVFPPTEAGESGRAAIDRMLAAEEAHAGPDRQYPGCIAGHMHVSADGTGVMVLSEWESADHHRAHFESVWMHLLGKGDDGASGPVAPDIDHHHRHYATVTAGAPAERQQP